ncbi:rhomboid family intramembrane serine protease [Caldibacillus lycopersici]|uniref:Rhomboid family intramembrane serine protease n=1 Tax=Perspicuibacillus lycopersici TaxID=1325689 RepID=A0AAE3ISY0_9BACI|nr:rhomboid family intramembrane serine protease [Perspicuibacillus lycopersici]MCU9613876.1 rhomboid family intramembrane serine protease [Perspicuibacillus lycopersici]
MGLREDYLYWRFTYFFIVEKKYRILNISPDHQEIWLENTKNKKYPVIRLKRMDIDWSNWLQRDLERTNVNGEKIRKALYKRSLEIVNIYISSFPPVDSYEQLLREQYDTKKIILQTFLVEGSNIEQTLKPINNKFGEQIIHEIKEHYDPLEVEQWKSHALNFAVHEAKKEKQLFQSGKPFFTYALLVVQCVIFLLLEISGGSTNPYVLLQFGAKYNPLILEGEWWRFFTPMFLHIGFLHLFMNSLALYYLGTAVERIFGNWRFLLIYFFAGFSGSLGSFLFSPNLSAGASGAIFGCFGALLFFGLVHPKVFQRTLGINILVVLALNLLFGFSVSSVDNAGHIGGLIGGFLAAGFIQLPKNRRLGQQSLFLLLAILIVGASLWLGFY